MLNPIALHGCLCKTTPLYHACRGLCATVHFVHLHCGLSLPLSHPARIHSMLRALWKGAGYYVMPINASKSAVLDIAKSLSQCCLFVQRRSYQNHGKYIQVQSSSSGWKCKKLKPENKPPTFSRSRISEGMLSRLRWYQLWTDAMHPNFCGWHNFSTPTSG